MAVMSGVRLFTSASLSSGAFSQHGTSQAARNAIETVHLAIAYTRGRRITVSHGPLARLVEAVRTVRRPASATRIDDGLDGLRVLGASRGSRQRSRADVDPNEGDKRAILTDP